MPNGESQNRNEDHGSASTSVRPTWDDVVKTKSPLQHHTTGSDLVHRYCVMSAATEVTEDLLSRSLKKPETGSMSCLELMSEHMAALLAQERKEHTWGEQWYGRWTQKWQVVTVLGQGNMDRYLSVHQPAQTVSNAVFDEETRKRMVRVMPLDVAMIQWRDGAGRYAVGLTAPGTDMIQRYVKSWKDGSQERMFNKFWDEVRSFGAWSMAHKLAGSANRLWQAFYEGYTNGSDDDF
ncbi:hypothetical protein GGF46_003503 [Coemansia sp. RSA 552]|nr:hypothetical protein GGF46_003503 [Coemansia sp. RSA 552]